MCSSLKKTAIALLAFSSSFVFAGTMGPECIPGAITTPCDTTAWNFGVSALYLKPVYDADFSFFNTSNLSPAAGINFRDYATDWHWGFKLEGSYHWGPGNDLVVNWYHLRSNSEPRDFGPFRLPNQLIVTDNQYERSVHWNAVNGELGQGLMYGYQTLRLHGGLHFASIATEENRLFSGISPAVAPWTDFRKSEFNGLGPRLGFDARYPFCSSLGGLGIYFQSAAAVLAGTSRFDNTSTQTMALGGVSSISGSKKAIVPELEAKLGLSYEYALAQADLVCDVGYMWFNYFNAQLNMNVSAPVGGNESDFAASGLYFGVVYKGYV